MEECRVSLSEWEKTSIVGSEDVMDGLNLIADHKLEITKDSADSDGVWTYW